MRRAYIILFCCFFSASGSISAGPKHTSTSAEALLRQAQSGSDDARVAALVQLMSVYDNGGQEQKKYEAFEKALAILRSRNDHRGLSAAFAQYSQLRNAGGDDRYPAYTETMLNDAKECGDQDCLAHAYLAKAQWSYHNYDAEDALHEAGLAKRQALGLTDSDLGMLSDLALADAYTLQRDTDRNIKAIDAYYSVLIAADSLEDPHTSEQCCKHLSQFYYNIDFYDSSVVFKAREMRLAYLFRRPEQDELQRMFMELAAPMLKCSQYVRGERIMNRVISYAIRHNNPILLADALTFMRNYYLERDDLAGIATLYLTKYREAWSISTPPLRARLTAFIDDAANRVKAADTSYLKALIILKPNDRFNYAYLSLFYSKFLMRLGRRDEAISHLRAGYEYVVSDSQLTFNARFTHALSDYFLQAGRYDSAFRYRLLYDDNTERLYVSAKPDALLISALQKQTERQRMQGLKAEVRRHERHVAQNTFIVFCVLAFFIILSVLSSFPVPRYVIRAAGFFAFVFLFEYILMVTEHASEAFTHGEPWLVLLFKIAVILMLSPLHHWTEEKTLHYFYEHKLIDSSKKGISAGAQRLRSWISATGTRIRTKS